MFVRIDFKVDPASLPDLKHKMEKDQLPVNILSLLAEVIDVTVNVDTYTGNDEFMYWEVELAEQPDDGSTLAAALRLMWRVHMWTMHYATKIVGAHVYE